MRIGFRKNLGHGFYVSHSVGLGGRRRRSSRGRSSSSGGIVQAMAAVIMLPFYLIYLLMLPFIAVFGIITGRNKK